MTGYFQRTVIAFANLDKCYRATHDADNVLTGEMYYRVAYNISHDTFRIDG